MIFLQGLFLLGFGLNPKPCNPWANPIFIVFIEYQWFEESLFRECFVGLLDYTFELGFIGLIGFSGFLGEMGVKGGIRIMATESEFYD